MPPRKKSMVERLSIDEFKKLQAVRDINKPRSRFKPGPSVFQFLQQNTGKINATTKRLIRKGLVSAKPRRGVAGGLMTRPRFSLTTKGRRALSTQAAKEREKRLRQVKKKREEVFF